MPKMVLEVMRYRKGGCGLATSSWSGVEFNQVSGYVIKEVLQATRKRRGHVEAFVEERKFGPDLLKVIAAE